MLRWVRGTIFGREVVPEVCNTNATSSMPARMGSEIFFVTAASLERLNFPAQPGIGLKAQSPGSLALAAALCAGVSLPGKVTRDIDLQI